MAFSLRGGRKTIISDAPPANPAVRTEFAVLRALARAHRWRQQIEGGEYSSISELATAQHVNESYACRLLRLTLISPAIVTDFLNGQHSSHLTLKELMKPLPNRWDEQASLLAGPKTSL